MWVAAAALVVFGAGCFGTDPDPVQEPQTVDHAWRPLPTLVVSAEHPVASVSFAVAQTGPVEDLSAGARWQAGRTGHSESRVRVEIRRGDHDPVPVMSGTEICDGDECLGDYVMEVRWISDEPGRALVTTGMTLSYVSDPARYPQVGLTGVTVDKGAASIVSEGDLIAGTRDWIAIRALEGLDPERRLVAEFEGSGKGPIYLITTEATKTLRTGSTPVTEWPIAMPPNCAQGACGHTVTFEMGIQDRDHGNASTHWRIIDYGSGSEPLTIEHVHEGLPALEGQWWSGRMSLGPGETYEERLRVTLPSSVLEGRDPRYPLYVQIALHGHVEGEETAAAALTISGDDGAVASGSAGDQIRLDPVVCPSGGACEVEVIVSTSVPRSASEPQTVSLTVNATTLLTPDPAPNVGARMMVEVVEP